MAEDKEALEKYWKKVFPTVSNPLKPPRKLITPTGIEIEPSEDPLEAINGPVGAEFLKDKK